MAQNDQLENYWNELIKCGDKHAETNYKSLVDRTKLLGFSYLQSHLVAALPLNQLIERLNHVVKLSLNQKQVEAVLGGVEEPKVRLDNALVKFWEYSKPRVLNKSPNQIRKWKNPRIKAINNLIKCVGNKPINELTRDFLH
jgi:hypothetical protein